jgi:branched-chain amino acid transport system ATP-binding protein
LKAVDNLNFEIKEKEIFGLIGPNGAGKTTVFNCITQFYKPNHGNIYFRDKHGKINNLIDHPVHEIIKLGLVRTFQNVLPFTGLTALENVEAGGLAAGLKRSEARRQAAELLARLGIAGKEERKVGTLPFGEERRVGIARALAMRPRYLLMDEPAAGLNDVECDELRRVVQDIRTDLDCGILLIEHRMSLVFSLCERIHVLQMGRTIASGSSSEIRADKAVRTAYLGDDDP